MREGRLRAIVNGHIEIREAPESALAGPGLVVAGARLDADAVEELADELERWLQERGRR